MYDHLQASQITQRRLIKLRWVSVLAMLAAALLSIGVLGSWDLMPRLLVLAATLATLNGCFHFAASLKRYRGRDIALLSPFVQLSLDLMAWGIYIYFSGGTTNPLISVLLPLVAIGAIVLRQAQAWLLGSLAIVTYSVLSQIYEPLAIADVDVATHLHLVGMWVVFVVSAIVLTWFILQLTKALRERDAALAAAREQAIRNDWLISIGSLAAEAAHELSTPLATVNVLVDDLLNDESLSPSIHHDLQLMGRQIEACKQALRQITRNAEQRNANAEPIAISLWLKGMLNGWLALNPQANVTCAISHALYSQGAAIDISIERAIANLLDNALKASATSIALNADLDGSRLTISVDDNGQGIAPDALRAFASGQPVESSSGMGIGLLLARAAVERHGGTLEIRQAATTGTSAQMILPDLLLREVSHAA